jgi:hypothetical protein
LPDPTTGAQSPVQSRCLGALTCRGLIERSFIVPRPTAISTKHDTPHSLRMAPSAAMWPPEAEWPVPHGPGFRAPHRDTGGWFFPGPTRKLKLASLQPKNQVPGLAVGSLALGSFFTFRLPGSKTKRPPGPAGVAPRLSQAVRALVPAARAPYRNPGFNASSH